MERETGFEPATSTLARLRSTNWAILAFVECSFILFEEKHDSQTIFVVQVVETNKSVLVHDLCTFIQGYKKN